MDKTTWESLPVGTNVRVTFPDQVPHTVIRIKGNRGAASGNSGLYGGKHWNNVLDWLDLDATFEVIFTPSEWRNPRP